MFCFATMFALATTTAPATPSAGDFLAGLARTPVVFEDVTAVVDLSQGVDLEVSYNLGRVGKVSLAAHGDDDGSAYGLVLVDTNVIAEFESAGDRVVWQRVDFTDFRPEQVEAVAASILQIWDENELAEAFATASTKPTEARSLKCKIAGGIAGAVTGVGVFAACELTVKNPVTCGKAGGSVWGTVASYISSKCEGAQNG